MDGSAKNPISQNSDLPSIEIGKIQSYEDYCRDGSVWDGLENILLTLSKEWRIPTFWTENSEFSPLRDYRQAESTTHFALHRLLELRLVRARILFVSSVPDRLPQTIHLVTEVEGPFPTRFWDLLLFCESAIPTSWSRVEPVIGWKLLGARLTDFGEAGQTELLSIRGASESQRRTVRLLYFAEGTVSFNMENPEGVIQRYRSLRYLQEAFAIGWKCTDVRPLATPHPNTHLATYYDQKELFTEKHFCESDWSSMPESPKPSAGGASSLNPTPTTRKNTLIVDIQLRDFLAKHHGYTEGKMGNFEHASWTELQEGTVLAKSTLSKALNRAFSQFEGTPFLKYQRACGSRKGIATYLIKSHDHEMPSRHSFPLRDTDGTNGSFDELENSDS